MLKANNFVDRWEHTVTFVFEPQRPQTASEEARGTVPKCIPRDRRDRLRTPVTNEFAHIEIFEEPREAQERQT